MATKSDSHSESLDFGDAAQTARAKYFDWVRQMMTLSAGSLTLLIALRNTLLGEHPRWTILLQASWAAFALSVGCAAIVLFSDHATLRSWVVAKMSREFDGGPPVPMIFPPRPIFQWASRAFPWLLAAAFVLLCAFAILNTPGGVVARP
jgi:hypothetical protein